MRASIILSTIFAASVLAQAVPEGIAPEESSPEGCEQTIDGNFTIGIAIPIGKRETATEAAGTALACTLEDGVLRDPDGRIGSIVANYQFQFDGPPQAGAVYTGGFSVCQNNSLAIGGSARWYRCMSGGFGNLYDRTIGDQCSEVRIVAQMINEPTPTPLSSSEVASTTMVESSSTWSVESASTTASVVSSSSGNSTVSTGVPESSGSPSASVTSGAEAGATPAPEAPAPSGGAVPMRGARRETFGAVIGILGAAMLL